jgi:hypothetical protein
MGIPNEEKLGDMNESNLVNQSYIQHAQEVEAPPIDPKKKKTNSISENFVGQKVLITKMIQPNGGEKIVNREKSALGPIILYLQENRLMEDWESN